MVYTHVLSRRLGVVSPLDRCGSVAAGSDLRKGSDIAGLSPVMASSGLCDAF
jgi:hypothetical protein